MVKVRENNNWIGVETPKHFKLQADKVLNKVKKERSKKEFKLVKVSDKPLTYKEVEIK